MAKTFILVLFVLSIKSAAFASPVGDSGKHETKQNAKQEAEKEFQRATHLFRAQEYQKAALVFQKAYHLVPHHVVLMNVALSYDRANQIPAAVKAYRHYLTAPVPSVDNNKIKERLKALEARIGELTINCEVPHCLIQVDGKAVGPAPVTVILEIGIHRISAHLDDRTIDQQRIDIIPKEKHVLLCTDKSKSISPMDREADLAQKTPVEQDPIKTELKSRPNSLPDNSKKIVLGVPFFLSAGLTGVSSILIVVFGVRAVDAHDQFIASDRQDHRIQQQGKTDMLVTNVMIGVTAASAVAMGIFAIHDIWFKDTKDDPALSIRPHGLEINF